MVEISTDGINWLMFGGGRETMTMYPHHLDAAIKRDHPNVTRIVTIKSHALTHGAGEYLRQQRVIKRTVIALDRVYAFADGTSYRVGVHGDTAYVSQWGAVQP